MGTAGRSLGSPGPRGRHDHRKESANGEDEHSLHEDPFRTPGCRAEAYREPPRPDQAPWRLQWRFASRRRGHGRARTVQPPARRSSNRLVQHPARHGGAGDAAPSPVASRHPRAGHPGPPTRAVPGVAGHAGGVSRTGDRHPRPHPGRVPPVEAHAPVPGPPPGAGTPDPCPHLLQVRGNVPGRLPQAEHGRGPGLLQQGGRDQAPGHRDGRGTVGVGAGHGVRVLRPGMPGVHGEGLLPPEAVPARADGDVRGGGPAFPHAHHRGWEEGPRTGSGLPRLARHRHQRGDRGGRHRDRHQVRHRKRGQPRAPPSDGDRPGGQAADGPGRRVPGRSDRVRGRRFELLRPGLSVHAGPAGRQEQSPFPGMRAGGVPHADERHVRLRLR